MSSQSSIESLKTQYFGLSKTIRRVLLSGIFAAIYAVLDMAVIQPLMEEYSEVTKSIEKAKADSKGFAAQLLDLKGTAGIDPSLSDQQQMEVATLKLNELESSISQATSNFITPQQMSKFLSELLGRSKNLTLLTMENLTPGSITIKTVRDLPVEKEAGNKKNAVPVKPEVEVIGEDKVFKHAVRMELRGKYTDIARYVQNIENMPWRLFWQELSLETDTYPYSRVTLEVYTLSLNKDWLTL